MMYIHTYIHYTYIHIQKDKQNLASPSFYINYRMPFDMLTQLDEYREKSGKQRTETITYLIQLALTILQNKENLSNPDFINAIIENLEADKIDDFFNKLEPTRLEALYAFAKAEMEKRYGKTRLDKFV